MDIRTVTGKFSASPQIAPGDLAELRAKGFASVICNRPDDEDAGQPSAADVAAAATAAGLAFHHIPVSGGGFGEPQVTAMVEAIDGAGGPVLAYCRTGTRSTLLWSLAQAAKGDSPDRIAAAAAGAGYDITPVRPAVDMLAARARA